MDLTAKPVRTHISILPDPSHAEPWIIAMSNLPGYLRTLEYSQHSAIEPMFSEFKSRSFGVEDTHLRHPDRLARLLLVMTLALYWAVSTGLWDAVHHPLPCEKTPARSPTRRQRMRRCPRPPTRCPRRRT